ncbi:hypothetical protein VTI74DRAFT_2462 [Chaetomium olivicolor]
MTGNPVGPTKAIPPEPPKKELAQRPPPLELDLMSPMGGLSRPPNRPLPPPPVTRSSQRPGMPASVRPPPLKPPAPLPINPPTLPSTVATQTSKTTTLRLPGSTKRLSWTSIASRRPIKYGKGKHSRVELVPQPSDDPDDPLNWPSWRKELNFWSLTMMVVLSNVMKTIFMTVNSEVAESYRVSYTAVAALTGVPLILSAFTGSICLIASRICGKRPLYLASLLFVVFGAVWNTSVASSFPQCMAARAFQGLGWGAFDTLVLGSIQDTYFEHERGVRIAIFSIVAATTTWSPPLIGGIVSQTRIGFSLQFAILSGFFVVAVPAIALGAPETAFDRSFVVPQTPSTAMSRRKPSLPFNPHRFFTLETFADYVVKLKPYAYSAPANLTTLLQVPRAFATPTTCLLALVTLLPSSALWGLTSSLSLLFHPLPFSLSPASIGGLFTAPFLLSTLTLACTALPLLPSPLLKFFKRFTPKSHTLTLTLTLACACALFLTGTLTLGLHLFNAMSPPEEEESTLPAAAAHKTSVFATDYLSPRVSLPTVSLTLGLVALATSLLASAAPRLIAASTAFTAPNLAVATRSAADMAAGVRVWNNVAAGVAVLATPNAVYWWDGLKRYCIGMGVAQVVVGAGVAAVWWLWGQGAVRRLDGRVLRQGSGERGADGDAGKRNGSFFDTD